MRLGYLVPEWPGQTHAFFWREMTALRSIGHDVYPISTRRPSIDACPHNFASEAHSTTRYVYPPGLEAAMVLAHRARQLPSALSYLLSLSESAVSDRIKMIALTGCAADLVAYSHKHQLDHIHVHSCANAAHIAAIARRLGGPSYSLTLHGDLPVYGKDHNRKMESASFVSVVTRPLQQQVLSTIGLPENKVPIIWMGVDTDRFTPAVDGVQHKDEFIIMTVARLNASKGHAYGLAAVRLLLDSGINAKYLIVGDGPHRMAIESTVEKLNLKEDVTLLGHRSESEVSSLLRRANVFLLPSVGLGEAAPVSVMEAMSCGVPVVCSRIGGTADMITDGVDGFLVDQMDSEGLALAMQRIAQDHNLATQISRNAREKAKTRFDYRVTAAMLASELERSIA